MIRFHAVRGLSITEHDQEVACTAPVGAADSLPRICHPALAGPQPPRWTFVSPTGPVG